jgi:hypothetical protein
MLDTLLFRRRFYNARLAPILIETYDFLQQTDAGSTPQERKTWASS